MDHFIGSTRYEDRDPDGQYFTLMADFGFVWDNYLVICPEGNKTDGLSVPRPARWYIAPFKSPLRRAAVPHDLGYDHTAVVVDLAASGMDAGMAFIAWRMNVERLGLVLIHGRDVPKKFWDDCFLAAMLVCRREATKKPTMAKIRAAYRMVCMFGRMRPYPKPLAGKAID